MSSNQVDSEHINIKVMNQESNVVQFKMRKSAPMKKLMDSYCARSGLNPATVRFRLDGIAIIGSDTPNKLNLEEGETIEAFQPQAGGFCMDGGDYSY